MLDLARFFKGECDMNYKTYKALNAKGLRLLKSKEQNQLDYLSDPNKAEKELLDIKRVLIKYDKLFTVSVFDYVQYFNNCGNGDYRLKSGCFDVDGIEGVAVKVENLKLSVADFESQFEKDVEPMLNQEATFDYVLCDIATGKKIAKLADGQVSMLTNSENLLFNEQTAMQAALEEKTLKNTNINLITSGSPFAITSMFNKTVKYYSCKASELSKKQQMQLNDAAWGIAKCNIDKKMDAKLSKINAEIDDLKSQFGCVRSGNFEAVK